ncbi:MAG: ABC transporter substrate-binding protein [Peptococcaceae bacterium]|jgi:peptide/nickel transport system substrate-binding protein|nr:ABC transporter substrate-binding protein [Peptococcaceae bacterium]
MKKIVSILLVTLLLCGVVGCGSAGGSPAGGNQPPPGNPAVQGNPPVQGSPSAQGNPQDSQPSASGQAPAGTQDTQGRVVRIAISSEPDDFDPMISAATDTQATVLLNVYEGLLAFNEKGEFIPSLAKSYAISDDGLSYSFELKQGIRFHNGQSFSSEDVKYTYEALAGLAGEAPLNATMSQLVKSVETLGEYAVVIHLAERNAGFITKTVIPICPAGYTNASVMPMGTGPYRFAEYQPGQKVTLEKNPDYTTDTTRVPSIDKAEFRIMTDPNARLMALKSGGLDISFIDASDIPALEGEFNIVETPSNMVQVMGLNNTVKPLDDVRVRQAINYAVNKDEIILGAFSGNGTRLDSFLSPVMAAYYNFDMDVYDTDLGKAKDLLKEAGLEAGFSFTITVPANYQNHIDAAQVIKNQLAKVGINAEIELVQWADWLDGVYTKAEYEATIIAHTGKLDPNDFLNRFDSKYGNNYFRYANPAYDALIAAAANATKESERAGIFKQCQQMLVDDAASVFITDPNMVYAVAKDLSGFKTYPVSFYDLASLSY